MSRRNGMQRYTAADAPTGFRQLPGFVATCHWFDCGLPTKVGITDVVLAVPVHDPPYRLDRIPLCEKHMLVFKLTGQLALAYHPEERLEQQE